MHVMKKHNQWKSTIRIVGSETAFPLLYTHFVKNGDWTLQQLVDYLTIKPCETFNLEYGTLKENGYADLTIIDLDSEQEIKGEDSAHFYTLLAEINDLSFQNEISKAIVEINELKSSLHHQALNDYEISSNSKN